MRVVYLSADTGIPVAGTKGASVHVRSLVGALARRGHRLSLVTTRSVDGPLELDCELVEAPFDRSLKRLRGAIAAAADGGPVLAGEAHKLLLNSACREALEEIDRRSGIDAIYERYSLWSTAGASFAGRRGIPWVVEVNAPLVREQAAYRDLSLRPIAEGIEHLVLSSADALFVPSGELRDYIVGRIGERKGIHVTPNGVDLELFSRPAPLPERFPAHLAGRFVIAFVGSLKAWHGIEPLLEAFRRLHAREPRAHLLVLGEGPMLPAVRRAEDRLGAEAVTVVGAVPHEEVPAWLRHAQVGVAPYPPLEEFYFSPIKVAEYMAAGLAVVASDIGQLREMVVEGETGLLVEPGDVDALTEALGRLATRPELAQRLGAAGRRRAESLYDWGRAAEAVESAMLALHRKRTERRERKAAMPRGSDS